MKSITPAGHTWVPVRIECPCGIDRMDCDYHKPDIKRKPISIKKLTTEDIDLVIDHAIQKKSTLTTITIDGKEYFPGKVYKSVEIPVNNFGPSIDFVIKP